MIARALENTRCIRPLLSKRLFHCSSVASAGHNKWSKIKHDKAKNDALKNAGASKFANQIAVATKLGGPDPSLNVKLASVIEQAQKANISKKVIENAIKRGSGDASSMAGPATVVVYEGIANGVSFVVEALTDNKARSAANVKAAFTKANGSFAPTLYMFTKRGWIHVDASVDSVFDKSIDLGAQDIEEADAEGTTAYVYTEHADTKKVMEGLKDTVKVLDFGIEYSANEDTAMSDESLSDDARVMHEKLVKALDELDDVTEVYTNLT